MNKWIFKLFVVAFCFVIGGICEHQRSKDSSYDSLVKFANRQAVEIAVIEQAAKLQQYKRNFKEASKNIAVVPKYETPADPKDVE